MVSSEGQTASSVLYIPGLNEAAVGWVSGCAGTSLRKVSAAELTPASAEGAIERHGGRPDAPPGSPGPGRTRAEAQSGRGAALRIVRERSPGRAHRCRLGLEREREDVSARRASWRTAHGRSRLSWRAGSSFFMPSDGQ